MNDDDSTGPGFRTPFGGSPDPAAGETVGRDDPEMDEIVASILGKTSADDPAHGDTRAPDGGTGLDPAHLRALFPPIEVAVAVAEAVDDIVPDPANSDPDALRAGLGIVAKGFRECAELKELASTSTFAPVARELQKAIRDEKRDMSGLRDRLERSLREAEKDAEAWAETGVRRPGGFAGMFATADDAREAARGAAETRKHQRETNEAIRKMQRETAEQRQRVFDKRHEEFLRTIQGRRY